MSERVFIYEKRMQDFIYYFYPIIDRFPKCERYATVAEMKNCCTAILKRIIRLKRSKNPAPLLHEIDIELELLRFLTQLSYKRGFLPRRNIETVASKLAELGRLTGALLHPKPSRDAQGESRNEQSLAGIGTTGSLAAPAPSI